MTSQFLAGEEHRVGDERERGNDTEDVRLNIIVIGGGIAGLGAAITLSRAGHKVTVSFASMPTSARQNLKLKN